jgi:excisionase family DNA binding protein
MSAAQTTVKLGYSVKEAALATSISRSTLYDLVAKGQIRSVSIGGRKVIPAAALHALINGEAA